MDNMAYITELAKALKQENQVTRVRILKALEKLEDPRATPSILEALDDCCQEVRRTAMQALSWIGDERARPSFLEALRDDDFSCRFWAAIGLQKVGDESCLEELIKALRDPDEGVRYQAVYALAEIGDRRAVNPLLEALEDECAHVREAAMFNLRKVFGVPVPSDFEKAERQMEEYSLEQRGLNEKMETVLSMIIKFEQASGAVRDEVLYPALASEHEIGDDEALDVVIQLMKIGLIDSLENGYRVSV
jgi:HEAT repeat protein